MLMNNFHRHDCAIWQYTGARYKVKITEKRTRLRETDRKLCVSENSLPGLDSIIEFPASLCLAHINLLQPSIILPKAN